MRNSQLDISSRMERHPTLHMPAWPKFSPFFGDRVFSKGFWPPRSPDLTPPDYFLWGILEEDKTLPLRYSHYIILYYIISERARLASLSDIPIRINQAASDRASAVAKFTGNDFTKYGAPCSILSGRKWWPLPAHVMMSLYLLHNEVSPLQVSLQYSH